MYAPKFSNDELNVERARICRLTNQLLMAIDRNYPNEQRAAISRQLSEAKRFLQEMLALNAELDNSITSTPYRTCLYPEDLPVGLRIDKQEIFSGVLAGIEGCGRRAER